MASLAPSSIATAHAAERLPVQHLQPYHRSPLPIFISSKAESIYVATEVGLAFIAPFAGIAAHPSLASGKTCRKPFAYELVLWIRRAMPRFLRIFLLVQKQSGKTFLMTPLNIKSTPKVKHPIQYLLRKPPGVSLSKIFQFL